MSIDVFVNQLNFKTNSYEKHRSPFCSFSVIKLFDAELKISAEFSAYICMYILHVYRRNFTQRIPVRDKQVVLQLVPVWFLCTRCSIS